MAIDIKQILSSALIELCSEKPLRKIKIDDFQHKTGISRQTFYNHFRDKQDLLVYFYEKNLISKWNPSDPDFNFCAALMDSLQSDLRYHSILKQAFALGGQNCLMDYMYENSRNFNLQWHKTLWGADELPDLLKLASDYHSDASMRMRILWITNDMPISPKELAEQIINMRIFGLSELLLKDNIAINPYVDALNQLEKYTF